jgi:hypothetical protein
LQLFGEPSPEAVEHLTAQEEFELWPENIEAIEVFFSIQTQWRVGPAGFVGYDYAGVMAALQFMGLPHSKDLFGKIRTMERAVLNLLAEDK